MDNHYNNAILDEVTENMRALYDEVRSGETELKAADSLANIAGKILKSEQLKLARDIFTDGSGKGGPKLINKAKGGDAKEASA